MKDHLIVVLVAFAGATAACQDDPSRPPSDGGAAMDAPSLDTAADAQPPDAAVADVAAADRADAAPPDAAVIDGALEDAPAEGAPAEGPGPDVAADRPPADTTVATDTPPADTTVATDTPPDAGETCGAGVSREML